MVAEVNYPVVPINTQTKETCVIPEITQTIVCDELHRPNFDKKVFSIGMIGSADNDEYMLESPQHKSKSQRCWENFKCHLQLRGPQKTLSVFVAKEWEKISDMIFWYVQSSKGSKESIAISARWKKNAWDARPKFLKLAFQACRWANLKVILNAPPFQPLTKAAYPKLSSTLGKCSSFTDFPPPPPRWTSCKFETSKPFGPYISPEVAEFKIFESPRIADIAHLDRISPQLWHPRWINVLNPQVCPHPLPV